MNEDETSSSSSKKNSDKNDFVYFKSSSIISILIIVIISLVCILATSLLIRSTLHSHSITRRLSIYFGFTPNRTQDDSILTFWQPKSIYDDDDDNHQQSQTIELSTIITSSSSTSPPPVKLTKSQRIFRNFILPSVLFLSILLAILAFYIRIHHHKYPAWGARPKRPDKYITVELK